MPRFTEEQYREICVARERGRLFLEKIYPYPQEPEQEATLTTQPPVPEWSRHQWDTVQQLRAMNLHLQAKLNEHQDKSKKRGKY